MCNRSVMLLALLALVAAACGGDLPPYTQLANICASPRAGTSDRQGSANDEKKFLRSWEDALYLWYREIPDVDPDSAPTVDAYFQQLITPVRTATNNPKDRFHFTLSTADWEQQSQGGVSAGYGVTFAIVAPSPPRTVVVALTQPGSEGASKLARGAKILKIDGVDAVNAPGKANADILNAGIFPATLNEKHTFEVVDLGSTTSRTITLTSTKITETPVQTAPAISTPTGKVGYILFNDHIATAEQELIDAVNALKTQGATELVLDMRYNGGGFLDIASELAFMVAGPQRTSGKTFEKLAFNDKYPSSDPVTGQPLTPTPFESTAAGFNAPRGAVLPHLDLPRVFVITSDRTCSASESVINSLMGVDVQVIAIGGRTCGKPYGFYPQDNCGTTYFSIEFQGVNNKGFGDYADGFLPGGGGSNPAGCLLVDSAGHALDDFGHALGDPAELLLNTALAYAADGACPAPPPANALTLRGLVSSARIFKPEWRMNRILRR